MASGSIVKTVTTAAPTSRRVKQKTDNSEDDAGGQASGRAAQAARTTGVTSVSRNAHPSKRGRVSGPRHTRHILAVMGFGSHEFGELALGPKATVVKRPRLISSLDPDVKTAFHLVQLDCGGMHTVGLTADNKIISWGVNDNGALGRDTSWDGGLRDVDDDSDSEADDLNPRESTPAEISPGHFPPGTCFTHVAAGDSCSFAVTDTGLVYGWGTFVVSWAAMMQFEHHGD